MAAAAAAVSVQAAAAATATATAVAAAGGGCGGGGRGDGCGGGGGPNAREIQNLKFDVMVHSTANGVMHIVRGRSSGPSIGGSGGNIDSGGSGGSGGGGSGATGAGKFQFEFNCRHWHFRWRRQDGARGPNARRNRRHGQQTTHTTGCDRGGRNVRQRQCAGGSGGGGGEGGCISPNVV